MAIPELRETLTLESLYDDPCRPGDIAFDRFSELMHHVSQELCVPVGRLRMADRFDRELAPVPGDEFDSGVSSLDLDLRIAARRRGRVLEGSVETLGDYLRVMNALY